MSTKTILNRIAKVAVAALLGGFLTVVSAPLANAATGEIDVTTDVGGAASTGICSVLSSAGAYQTVDSQIRDYTSTEAAPYTVTVALGGTVDVEVDSAYFTYTANGVISSDTTNTLHQAYGLWSAADLSSEDTITFTAAAVGTSTVLSYASAPFSSTDTPASSGSVLADPDGKLVIVVVASCGTGIVDLDESGARVDGIPVATANIADARFTYGDTLTYAAGGKAYITAVAKNAYGNAIPSTSTWTVSATNGAKVTSSTSSSTIAASTTANGTLSSISATAGGTLYVRVTAATSGVAQTTTVTVTAAGTTILSKTITFLPEATKMVVVSHLTGSISDGEGLFAFQLQAADGTVVPGSIEAVTSTLDSRVNSATQDKAATINPAASAGTTNTIANTAIVGATTKLGLMSYTCNSGTTSGTTKVTFRHSTPVKDVDIDTVVELSCSGGLDTYTISMDKASYKIGEVGTLTITAKDSTGAAVNDWTTIGTGATVSPGGGSMVKSATAGALGTGDQFTAGKKTYQIQMTTAGAFNTVVNFPGVTTKSATVGYTVVDGSGAVSNAEVLAAIVKLIASINKQIAKLQKLIKK